MSGPADPVCMWAWMDDSAPDGPALAFGQPTVAGHPVPYVILLVTNRPGNNPAFLEQAQAIANEQGRRLVRVRFTRDAIDAEVVPQPAVQPDEGAQ